LPAIPYASKTFDAVVCTETLEHITNTNETVAEIARVVRPGGIVIISVPHGTVDREEVHVHRFTVKRFKKTLLPYFHVDNIDVIVEGTNQTLLARTTRYQ
jgi:2-polyprenyl-3-methyl-5-hydroxy-6-metoxy-1,4-benzoquinol methylase